jgi:hypothetical protein
MMKSPLKRDVRRSDLESGWITLIAQGTNSDERSAEFSRGHSKVCNQQALSAKKSCVDVKRHDAAHTMTVQEADAVKKLDHVREHERHYDDKRHTH